MMTIKVGSDTKWSTHDLFMFKNVKRNLLPPTTVKGFTSAAPQTGITVLVKNVNVCCPPGYENNVGWEPSWCRSSSGLYGSMVSP